MPLTPGTTLGPYSVTAKIGEGGMGEVYRARDTELDRDVAPNVLPQAFTDDPDRLARFEREAKVLASLNHPTREFSKRSLPPGRVLTRSRWIARRAAEVRGRRGRLSQKSFPLSCVFQE